MRGNGEEAAMRTVYEALQTLSDEGACHLVAMLRAGASMRQVARLAREYTELRM